MLTQKVQQQMEAERELQLTLQQISDKYHIPQSHIANLLNGKRGYKGISLGTFDRMFPNATVDLGVLPGGTVSATRSNVINNNFGEATQTYNEAPRDPDGELLRKAADLATDLATEAGQVPLVPLLKGLRGLRDRK